MTVMCHTLVALFLSRPLSAHRLHACVRDSVVKLGLPPVLNHGCFFTFIPAAMNDSKAPRPLESLQSSNYYYLRLDENLVLSVQLKIPLASDLLLFQKDATLVQVSHGLLSCDAVNTFLFFLSFDRECSLRPMPCCQIYCRDPVPWAVAVKTNQPRCPSLKTRNFDSFSSGFESTCPPRFSYRHPRQTYQCRINNGH